MEVFAHYGVRTEVEREGIGQFMQSAFEPRPSVLEVIAGSRIVTTKKRATHKRLMQW